MKPNTIRNVVLSVLRKQWKISLFLLLCIIAVVLISLIPPQLLKLMIDRNLVTKEYSGLFTMAALYLSVMVAIGLFDFLKGVVLTILGQKITREIRTVMMTKAERINAQYYTSNGSGAIVSRFTNDVASIDIMFTSGLVGMVIDCFKIIGIILSMAFFNGWLGLAGVLLLPLIFLITRLFQKRMLKAQIENRIQVGKVNHLLTESLKNVHMIKAASKELYSQRLFTDSLEQNYRTIAKINFNDSLFPPVIQTTRALLIAFIVLLSASNLAWIGISVGMIAASIELISDLFSPIENLGMELQSIQQSISGIRRVNAFLDEQEDEAYLTPFSMDKLLSNRNDIHLNFEQVSFRYDEGNEVLKHLHLTINPHEKVAFIGRTGVGKTTLFKLCMGLLKPQVGRITLNGMDVCQIPNAVKRNIFGYVDQSFPMIKGSVGDQISLLDTSITRSQIEKAIEIVGLKETIALFPMGIDTFVKNETQFSQGQRQLLAIARAIVTNPPLLLFDEITANLDSITEAKIHAFLLHNGNSHTILSISHRLTSMLASDTIVILEDGQIKQSGSPEQMIQKDEWYRKQLELERLSWD